MTLQEQIIKQRTAQGLKIILQLPEGDIMNIYPKDQATKARWIAGYRAKGMTILEHGESVECAS